LRHARRAAHVAEREHFDFEALLAARDDQRIADAHAARGFRALSADLDLAGLDRLPGQPTGAEETRGPEPEVEANRARGGVRFTAHSPPAASMRSIACTLPGAASQP
jgi:hypothetical protein